MSRLLIPAVLFVTLFFISLSPLQARANPEDEKLREVYLTVLSERRQVMELLTESLGAQEIARDRLALLRTLEEGGLRLRRGGIDLVVLQQFIEVSVEMQEELLRIAQEKTSLDERSRTLYEQGLALSHQSIRREWAEANPIIVTKLARITTQIANASKQSGGNKGLAWAITAATVISEGRKLAQTKAIFGRIRQLSDRNRELDRAFRTLLKEEKRPGLTPTTEVPDQLPDLPQAAVAQAPRTGETGTPEDRTGETPAPPATMNIPPALPDVATASAPEGTPGALAAPQPTDSLTAMAPPENNLPPSLPAGGEGEGPSMAGNPAVSEGGAIAMVARADAPLTLRLPQEEAGRPKSAESEGQPSSALPLNADVALVVPAISDEAPKPLEATPPASINAASALTGRVQADALFAQGVQALSRDLYDQALTLFENAVEISPEHALAWNGCGVLYAEQGEAENAYRAFTRAITADPKNLPAYNNRALLFFQQGKIKEAIKDYDRALAIRSDNPAIYNNRAIAYASLGHTGRAIADYSRAITLAPQYAAAYNNRALAYRDGEDYTRSIDDFTRLLALLPHHETAFTNRLVTRRLAGDLDGALADAETLVMADPSRSSSLQIRGMTHYLMGHLEEAMADYRQALTLEPRDPYAALLVLMMRAEQGGDDVQAWARIYQESSGAADWTARLFAFYLGELDERSLLREAGDPRSPLGRRQFCEATFYTGMMRLAKGESAAGLRLLQQSVDTRLVEFTEYMLARHHLSRWNPADL